MMSELNELPYRNLLDDVEFCIRKGIGFYCIPRYLRKMHLSQAKLGGMLGINQENVSRWKSDSEMEPYRIDSTMKARHAPTTFEILKCSSIFHISVETMIREVVAAEEVNEKFCKPEILEEIKRISAGFQPIEQKNGDETKGSDHFERIDLLRNSVYIGFFLESNGEMSHFIMETSEEATHSASVHAFIRLIGKAAQIYRCNIVAPTNQKHLYVYMRQDGGKNDRGILTFRMDTDMQDEFVCGSGLMYSTARKNGEKRIQWVVILKISDNHNSLTANSGNEKEADFIRRKLQENSQNLNQMDGEFVETEQVRNVDEIIEPVLRQNLPSPTGFYLDFKCLDDRQEEIYEEIYSKKLKSVELSSVWEKTHKEQAVAP